jgi:di/tricarboxylate transporter
LLLVITLFILTKVATYSEIKKGLDLNLAIIAALAVGIGKGIINSGFSDTIAKGIQEIFSPIGILGTLAAVYIITNILTEFVTNVAAASITFPIALSSANLLSVDPKPFILAVAFGASASFITPVGYQTNLMVYSAGNYKFGDFLKIGFPISILYGLVCIIGLYFLYF